MGIRRLLLCTIAISAAMLNHPANAAGASFPIKKDQVLSRAIGDGSIPAVLLKDGTVCRTGDDPLQCEALGKIPKDILTECSARYCVLDGLFDYSESGEPEVFLQWWPKSRDASCADQKKSDDEYGCDFIAVYVLKNSAGVFRPIMKLSTPTMGYEYDAWFRKESPPKVVLMTRCGGSSGRCLVYFNPKKHSLDPITDLPNESFYVEGSDQLPGGVAFEDIDNDGSAEIFVEARGRDRTSDQGAGLFRWNGHGYQLWWPKWKAPPYVIYAQLVSVPGDDHKEIVAVVDPNLSSLNLDFGSESRKRELRIWKLENGEWAMAAKKKLPDVDTEVSFPSLDTIRTSPRGLEIPLENYSGLVSIYDYTAGQLSGPRLQKTSR